MEAEGTRFRTSVTIGQDIGAGELRARYDAVVLAIGATAWRELPVPGRELAGVHQAMEYLPQANRVCQGDLTILAAVGRGQTRRDHRRRRHRRGLSGHGRP